MERAIGLHPIAAPPPVWRRLFHLGVGSSIPIVAIFSSGAVMVGLMAALAGMALVMEAARFRLPSLNQWLLRRLRPLLKQAEDHRVTGASYIAVSALVCFLAFDKPIAITALFFLSLGDPAAALVGSRMRGVRFFGKSPGGTLAFAAVSLAMVGVLSAVGVVPFHWGLLVGAVVAAIVELGPSVVDDNLTIPLISGAVMTALV